MAKYNIFEELILALRSHSTLDNNMQISKSFFSEFTQLAKKKVGNKFVTRFENTDTHGVFHDRKIVDLVQDMNGNLLGLRAETFDKNGYKLAVEKITPNIKSDTQICNGIKTSRRYGNFINADKIISYNYITGKPNL